MTYALVTGGSRGLGAGCALALARDGFDIALTYRERRDSAQTIADKITAMGRQVHLVQADFSLEGEAARVADALSNAGIAPEVLVNNAGEVLRQPLAELAEADFHRHLLVNVTALFALTKALAPSLARNGQGSVINFGSVHGLVSGRNMSAYATGKAALIGLTKALSVELAPDIRVNLVQPGIFATEINDALIGDPVAAETVRKRIPAGRFGQPDDLADVVCFLAGRASRYITGATLAVDAGLTARIGLPSGDAL